MRKSQILGAVEVLLFIIVPVGIWGQSTTTTSLATMLLGGADLPTTLTVSDANPKSSNSLSREIASLETSKKSSPTDGKTSDDDRLLSALGSEAYFIPVNITTPANTPLEDVIRILAERAQLNFVVAEGVLKGNVTLRMRDVPLGTVLNSLLSSHDLVLIKDGPNVLRIVPRGLVQGGNAFETKTRSKVLNWIPAGNLKDTVSQLSKTANVQVDSASNTIFVTDAPASIDLIMDIIDQLDIPPRQVQVDSFVVEVLNEDSLKKHANVRIQQKNEWLAGVASPDYIPPQRFFDAVAGVGTLNGGGIVNIFGSEYDIRGTLQWAEDQRIAKILANPNIVTLDNQKATIDIITKVPYVEAQQGVGGSGTTANAVKFEDTGIKLDVTPQITNNGYVRLNIMPEQKVKTGDFQNNGSPVPIIATRKAATTVIVKDEDTVVIGGLSQLQNDKTNKGVPWLRKAPVFGQLFDDSSKYMSKNKLAVFVTPRIVKTTGIPKTNSSDPQEIKNCWDLPDYFYDDSLLNRAENN